MLLSSVCLFHTIEIFCIAFFISIIKFSIIGYGARGGRGAATTGNSLGAMARGVVWLDKGEHLYFMIGQPGLDACPKVNPCNLSLTK